MFGNGVRRSSLLPIAVGVVILAPAVIYYLHVHARFHQIKTEIKGPSTDPASMEPRPGGSEAIVLKRTETPGNNMPEFLSVTVLPGMGMDVLQITANLPRQGETALLAAPSVRQMADGSFDKDTETDLHGALEAPWAGSLHGLLSPLANAINTAWHGKSIEVPTNTQAGMAAAVGGLLMLEQMDTTRATQADGSSVTGTVHGTTFGGRWPSSSDVTSTVQLGAHAVEITLTARNAGTEAEPMGLGWDPRFSIPGKDRSALELKLPAGQMLEIADRVRMVPSGKTLAAAPELTRFQGRPAALGTGALNLREVHLKAGVMDQGPQVTLRDPAGEYELRMTVLSPTVRELQVSSPASTNYIALGAQTSLDDPLGRQWAGEEGGAITTLQPGQTLEWKVRLEILPLMAHAQALP